MPQSRQCPKCSGSMSEGFVADRTNQSAAAVPSWTEGQPERSVWTGLKLGGKPRFDISTWRCARCGFLEHYAAGEESGFDQAQKKHVQTVVLIVVIATAVVAAVAAGVVAAVLGR